MKDLSAPRQREFGTILCFRPPPENGIYSQHGSETEMKIIRVVNFFVLKRTVAGEKSRKGVPSIKEVDGAGITHFMLCELKFSSAEIFSRVSRCLNLFYLH